MLTCVTGARPIPGAESGRLYLNYPQNGRFTFAFTQDNGIYFSKFIFMLAKSKWRPRRRPNQTCLTPLHPYKLAQSDRINIDPQPNITLKRSYAPNFSLGVGQKIIYFQNHVYRPYCFIVEQASAIKDLFTILIKFLYREKKSTSLMKCLHFRGEFCAQSDTRIFAYIDLIWASLLIALKEMLCTGDDGVCSLVAPPLFWFAIIKSNWLFWRYLLVNTILVNRIGSNLNWLVTK